MKVRYIGKPFYLGTYDKEVFPGHIFTVTCHPLVKIAEGSYKGGYMICDSATPWSPHIHVRSEKYPNVITEFYEGEYTIIEQ